MEKRRRPGFWRVRLMMAFCSRFDVFSRVFEILRPSRPTMEEDASLRWINFKPSKFSIGSSWKGFGASPSCRNAGKCVIDS